MIIFTGIFFFLVLSGIIPHDQPTVNLLVALLVGSIPVIIGFCLVLYDWENDMKVIITRGTKKKVINLYNEQDEYYK